MTGSWKPEGHADNVENVEPGKEVTFPGVGRGIGVMNTDSTITWKWSDIGSVHTGTFSDDCNSITWENEARWFRVQSQGNVLFLNTTFRVESIFYIANKNRSI